MTNCPSCGGKLIFDIKLQRVKCVSCGNDYHPENLKDNSADEQTDEFGVTSFICPNCAGEIYSTDRDLTGVCSYCGTAVTFESRLKKEKRPALILPFQKTKEDCKQSYLEAIRKDWFAPKELKDPKYIEGFRGIYMPYWVKDIRHFGDLKIYASKSEAGKGTYVAEDTWRFAGKLNSEYKNMYHDASTAFSDDISERVEPFELGDTEDGGSSLKPFYTSYLNGFYAEPADLSEDAYDAYFDNLTYAVTDDFIDNHELFDKMNILIKQEYGAYDALESLDEEALKAEKERLEEEAKTLKTSKDKAALKAWQKQEQENAKLKMKERQDFEKVKREAHKAFDEKKKEQEEQLKNGGKIPEGEKLLTHRIFDYEVETSKGKLALLPVWFLSYRKGNRVAYVTINGQSGKVTADLPVDLKKVFGLAAVLAVVLFAAFYYLTLRPISTTVFAVWFAAIALAMMADEHKEAVEHASDRLIHDKRHTLTGSSAMTGMIILVILLVIAGGILLFFSIGSDTDWLVSHAAMSCYAGIGMIVALTMFFSCMSTRKKLSAENKNFPYEVLCLISAVLGFGLVWKNPPSDYLYYGVCGLTLIFIALGLSLMIKNFNNIVSRPLPQFAHKGGDDRA